MAYMLSQITATVISTSILDKELRQLYLNIYRALSKRRSLLLLNYEEQVRVEELPWSATIAPYLQSAISYSKSSPHLNSEDMRVRAMELVKLLAISVFPFIILPNDIIEELIQISTTLDLETPLTKYLDAGPVYA